LDQCPTCGNNAADTINGGTSNSILSDQTNVGTQTGNFNTMSQANRESSLIVGGISNVINDDQINLGTQNAISITLDQCSTKGAVPGGNNAQDTILGGISNSITGTQVNVGLQTTSSLPGWQSNIFVGMIPGGTNNLLTKAQFNLVM